MAETLEARLEFLRRQLHAISLSIQDARARGDQAAIDRLVTLWRKVQADRIVLEKEALAADSPSAFMQTLDSFGDEVIKTGVQLRDAGANIVTGIGATVKYLPLILLVALLVVGLVVAGKLGKDLRK